MDLKKIGRIEIGLFGEAVPRTVKNFVALCNHTFGYGYNGSPIHRIVPGLFLQGGDITEGNGFGGKSIYGLHFIDENRSIPYSGIGTIAMMNAGNDANGSQFFITLGPTPWLKDRHVVFGHVLKGIEILKEIEKVPTRYHRPRVPVIVSKCGEVV
eukprot:MONOS_3445.1-p1 / transcript=MONOS_3445.1 / gene=MONOS_3445 / organism=Monocercomonoides_exilis_PA203 / gene_product=Peptidyl-prolyl cis-trans isomerase 5 / transcript_product=Peptidyl-prolyl cis-trans isomerase 5 / location=Mono_scaffold00081:73725-74312(-) / protein_length=154 / sequence_SO=supercontig / SO=protein_coding / is_pseudo=false